MSYRLQVAESNTFGVGKFVNANGHTECVEFVRQATGAPPTSAWRQGVQISEAKPGAILRGTAIATFDKLGRYPVDALGKHAAIYLEHNSQRIRVLDQWADQREVKERLIWFNRLQGTRRSNDANTFYVIE